MIIEGEWRETSLAFIDFIKINYNEDPYDYLKCMGYEIPYINNLKCGILYDYFKSYIELFRFLADIKSDINCLVFAPNINSNEMKKKFIANVMSDINLSKSIILVNQEQYSYIFDVYFPDYKLVTVSYNSKLDIASFMCLDDYLHSLKSKNRIFLNKCLKHFNDFGDVSFGKLDIKNEKSTMIDLYIETCDRHKDFRECDDFFLNLDETQKVEWYGIFKESELIMFSGYWKNSNSVVFGMFGKNYKYEKLIRKSYAYFVMNINMIQQAINDNYKIIYSSYGEKNIKKQMGYMIENYACVMPKN